MRIELGGAAIIVALLVALFTLGMKAGELRVRWLQSVVTEEWVQDGLTSWKTVSPAIYGQRGDPLTVIGLREDGVVVWKNKESDDAKTQ